MYAVQLGSIDPFIHCLSQMHIREFSYLTSIYMNHHIIQDHPSNLHVPVAYLSVENTGMFRFCVVERIEMTVWSGGVVLVDNSQGFCVRHVRNDLGWRSSRSIQGLLEFPI